ncbi:MAG: peptidylprolyl isomerase [Candidatus Omnitrophica bacterium]|nr:peptidylprolyl isomerase [Candidatus Omnitrophota bacterium]
MKKRIWLILGWGLVWFGAAFGGGSASAEVLERILAVVNDEVITEQDLQIVMAPVAAQYRTLYTGQEFTERFKELRQEFLNKLIEDKLVLSEAKRKQVIVKDEEVDEMLGEVREKFPNREVFLKAISEQGLTEKKLWNRFRDQLLMQKLVAYEVKSKVSVSPGDTAEYYKTHEKDFAQGDRVKLQHILIRVGSRSEEEAKAFIESLAAKWKEGKPFEELAKTYSEGAEAKEGGEMGWVERGQLLGEIDEKVFALNEGEATPPIRSSLGYHVFKVAARQKFSVKPLSEVRDVIQDLLFKEKLRVRLESWISQLKKNAYISIR